MNESVGNRPLKSPCPRCGTELFSRRLRRSWKEAARCPECQQRLTTDPGARRLAAGALLLIAVFHVFGRSVLASWLGEDGGSIILIVSLCVYVAAAGLLIYSIMAFPYVVADES